MKRIMLNLNDDVFQILEIKACEKKQTVSSLCKEIVINASKTYTPVKQTTKSNTQQIINNAIADIITYANGLKKGEEFVLADVDSYKGLAHGHKVSVGTTWNERVETLSNVQRALTRKNTLKFRGSAAVYKKI